MPKNGRKAEDKCDADQYDEGANLSPYLFNLCIDDVIHNWQMNILEQSFMPDNSTDDTLLFADNHAILSNSKSGLWMAVDSLDGILSLIHI